MNECFVSQMSHSSELEHTLDGFTIPNEDGHSLEEAECRGYLALSVHRRATLYGNHLEWRRKRELSRSRASQ